MTKSLHPLYLKLRFWAAKIESNLLNPGEAKEIAEVFRRVAAGEEFDEVLGVKRVANRPRQGKRELYVEQIFFLTQSVFNYRDQTESKGMQVNEAIATVADAFDVSPDSVKAAYYSKEGKNHLAHIQATLKHPLSEM